MTGELPKEPTPDVLESMMDAAKNLGIDTGSNDSAPTPPTPPAAEGTTEPSGAPEGQGGDPEKLLAGQDGQEGQDSGKEGQEDGSDGKEGGEKGGKKPSEEKKPDEEKEPELPDTTGTEKPEKKTPDAKKQPAAADRDKDLEFQENQHQSPKTKKIIETLKTAAKQARDERDMVTAKLRTEVKEMRAMIESGSGMTPAMKKQYDQYRDMVRQLQIERDPEIVEKYDNRISSNIKRVCDILSEQGLGTDENGKKIPGYMEKLVSSGSINLKNLTKTLKTLEDAGEVEAAEEIRAALLENSKLSRERVTEIEAYKKDFDARQVQSQESQKRMIAEATERFNSAITKDVQELGNAFPELKRPPEPTDSDDEGTKAAKLKAIESWQTELGGIIKKIESIAGDNQEGEVTRFRTAIQGLIIRDALVPRMRNQIKSLKSQLDAANSTLGKFRKAGTLPATGTAKPGETAPAKTGASSTPINDLDAITEAAKKIGINVD